MSGTGIVIILAFLGCIPLFLALWQSKRRRDLLRKGDIVTGTIVDVYERRGYRGSVYYQALIEYPVFNQAPMQGYFIFGGAKALEKYYRGRKLQICYDKKQPKRFMPRDAPAFTWLMVVGVVLALLFLVLCYFLYEELTGMRF